LIGRFWEKVNKNGPIPPDRPDLGPCWIWHGAITRGYGTFRIGKEVNGTALAHRLSYQWLVGPLPDGLELDHLCFVRCCVNPAHLEPVTHSINLERGMARWNLTPEADVAKQKRNASR
jgi:hypothetical protein